MKTLIIDDDEVARILIKKKLEKTGFFLDPSDFENGFEAYKHLISCFKPDEVFFIFLDINMPVMNGWEFLEKIEAFTPDNTNINVFIISSSINKLEIENAKKFKMVKLFLSKPILNDGLNLIQDEISKYKSLKMNTGFIKKAI